MNGQNLKEILMQALSDLKLNQINVQEATAISAISREIVRITNTQLKIAAYSQTELAASVVNFAEDKKA